MYITQIDDLFDDILNKLYKYIITNQILQKYQADTNFVKYQNDIMGALQDFITKHTSKKDILDLVKNQTYYEFILATIKRYCAFYIYLGIAYYYKGGRDLYITNIIELSKYQKDTEFQIPNFYNSENNAKIITAYNDIKNMLSIFQAGRTIDKIKIILSNNPVKFDSTIKLFNELGEDYIIDNFLINDNFHNILKTLIFKQIYIKEEKDEMLNFLNQEEKEKGEYKYIDIIISNEKKIVDFNQIQKILSVQQLKLGLAEEIYNYLVEMRETKEYVDKENQDFINFLFSKEILIPISEEFIRYHDDNEKYDPGSLVGDNLKNRDATKIKYIINKMNNVRNFYSSLMTKNPKLKLDTEKMFHKSYDPRQVVLINENEELKIVQKLKMSENTADIDLLIDLENIRKYAYTNYKNFSKDGFKLRTSKPINSIRSINLKQKKLPLELRIAHDSLEVAVIGIAWNPSNINLGCFTTDKLINVNKLLKLENGYKSFTNIITKTFDKKGDSLYYWLFDINKDIPKLKGYVDLNSNDPGKNIKIMISEIYHQYIELVKNKFETYINNLDEITIWNLDNILKGYSKKYFDFNLNPEIRNELIEKTLKKRLKEITVEEDDVDNMIPGKRNKIIELPILKKKDIGKNIIYINSKNENESTTEQPHIDAKCYHYKKWGDINKMSKTDDFSQKIFDFIKQYATYNKTGDFICKSCNEILPIKKYIYEGTYNNDSDIIITTGIAVNQNLEEIPKYAKYTRTIRNLEKNIEKIAYLANLNSYIGSTPSTRSRRKIIIKDVLDIIILHTEYLKKQPKDRIQQSNKKYNINVDLTNLFFFELKDEIFLTSSTDTDYYKLIKYNNVIIYLFFIMLLDLNHGNLLELKDDKKCNYFFYEQFGPKIFGDLYLRVTQKEKIPMSKFPLLCYAMFYFACIFTNNKIWLWNTKTEDIKSKQFTNITVQKTIIHTLLDLINSIAEANFDKDKNYMYGLINIRFLQKINSTFNDSVLASRIQKMSSKNINYDDKLKKINFTKKKIETMEIVKSTEYVIEKEDHHPDKCISKIKVISYLEQKSLSNNLDILTSCSSGEFHTWEYNKGNMICKKCNQSYNELIKIIETSTTTPYDENKLYLHKLKIINLNKLVKKYCVSGNIHDLNAKGFCNLCNKNPNKYSFSVKELELMGKNIESKTYEITLFSLSEMRKFIENKEKENEKIKTIINKFNSRYEKNTENKLHNYISVFIERIIKIMGNKIKINTDIIYMKDTVYIIDHDYLGNDKKEHITILQSDNKIEISRNHSHYKCDIIYYKDNTNNVFVFYDLITLQYLGYSENNKEFKKSKANPSLKIHLSLKDCIMQLGLENQFLNLYHLNSSFQNMTTEEIMLDSENIVNNYLRTRSINLKQIISRIQSIINNIKNSGKNVSLYGIEEKKIVNDITKKIKNFKMKDDTQHDSVFKHWKIISDNIELSELPENIKLHISKNYIDTLSFNNLNNIDCKLIFYLIFNLNRLLDYNTQHVIQTELCHLIIRIIRYSFDQYYRPYFNTQVRKFDFILISQVPYIDENLKVVGFYQELLSNKEIEDIQDKEKDNNIDNKEAFESMDIDDYEMDGDDIDYSMEALDGGD